MPRSKPPSADPTEATATALRVVLGKLVRRLRAEASPSEMTSPQKAVLSHLEQDGPATISGLARAMGVRPQSMSTTIAALEAAGLVHGEPDPGDGRKVPFSLTRACVGMLRAGRAAREDWPRRALLSKLDASERRELTRAPRLLSLLAD